MNAPRPAQPGNTVHFRSPPICRWSTEISVFPKGGEHAPAARRGTERASQARLRRGRAVGTALPPATPVAILLTFLLAVLSFTLLPTAASAATLEVCDTCTHTAIADALALAQSGDVVDVGAGVWIEGDLQVPAGVTLQGAGRGWTILDAASAASPYSGVTLGDGATVTDLQILPDAALGTGVLALGGATIQRVDVRGGQSGLASMPSNTAPIHVESTLVALGTAGLLGIDAWHADWSLDRVTLYQEPGGGGTAVQATAVTDLQMEHALVVGWERGLWSGSSGCSVLRSLFWQQNSDAWDDCELLPGLPTVADSDPLFVDPTSAVGGDFHLQSTAGEWTGVAFVPGVADSPALDAAHDGDASAEEADGACNLPNLGAYGGTAEASRGAFADCPFTNVDTGEGFPTLTAALAALATGGQTIWIRDGEVDAGLSPTTSLGVTLEAAPSAATTLCGRGHLLLLQRGGIGTQQFFVGGFAAAPAGLLVAIDPVGIYEITIHDVFQSSGEGGIDYDGVGSSTSSAAAVTILDSEFGALDQPLDGPVFRSLRHVDTELTLERVVGHAAGSTVELQCNANDLAIFSIQQSQLRSNGAYGSVLSIGNGTGSCIPDVDISSSVLVTAASGVNFQNIEAGTLNVANTLVLGPNNPALGEGIEFFDGFTGLIQNSLIAGFGSALEWDDGSGVQVINSIISHNRLGLTTSAGTPSPFTVQYSAFFNNSTADTEATLATSNLFGCDAHDFQPAINQDLDPLDFLAPLQACAVDAGN